MAKSGNAEFVGLKALMRPRYFSRTLSWENLALMRGARAEALRAYANALNRAPDERAVRLPIEQLRRVSSEDLSSISAMRNTRLE